MREGNMKRAFRMNALMIVEHDGDGRGTSFGKLCQKVMRSARVLQ